MTKGNDLDHLNSVHQHPCHSRPSYKALFPEEIGVPFPEEIGVIVEPLFPIKEKDAETQKRREGQ